MGLEGLDWQLLNLPLAAGLNQRTDDRARPVPYLDICKDVQFDELGGIQTRYPYATIGALADCRRVVDNDGELLVFTKTQLKSWNPASNTWITKGTHLAVKVDEETVFANTGDQIDCDRAELSGTIVYTWADAAVGANGTIYVAARNKATGTITLPPVAISSATRPRLVAVDSSILLFYVDPSDANALKAIPLDPANPTPGSANTLIGTVDAADFYDVCRIIGTGRVVGAAKIDATHYTVFTVDNAGDIVTSSSKNRAATRAIAVSSTPDGASVQVIRGVSAGEAIKGDLITISTLADTAHVDVAIGTTTASPIEQIACAHRSVQNGGQYRCYVFWDGAEGDTAAITEYNWIDTSGAVGTAATFVKDCALASRAFDYAGQVYVHLGFAGVSTFVAGASPKFASTLQNTYFLYRDDALLVAKMAAMRAGGYLPHFSHLPNVALTDGTTTFSWCGTERRIVPLGTKHTGYSDRGPRDITFTFDSNEARRTARLGKTLYITGGEVMQYDGTRLVEVGFHIFPWFLAALENSSGAIADGTYTYKVTWRWNSGTGERDRSTTATHGDATLTGGTPQGMGLAVEPLFVTHKTDNPPAIEIWRTADDPLEDSPFYLVTSSDPAATTNPNRYLANSAGAFSTAVDDELADADLATNEGDSEGEGELPNLAPPPCTIIAANDTRLFIAGVAGDPDRVWYSLLRGDGEVARFNGELTIDVPPPGGAITALAFLQDTLIVFRETAIYAFAGFGFDNTAGGQNYGPARTLATDVGAINAEGVALTAAGLMFKSRKGWFLLPGATAPVDIGDKVSDYDSETPLAIDVLRDSRHIRMLSAQRMLVYETNSQQWGEWTIADGLHACIWNGTHVYLASAGPKQQLTTYTALDYGIDVETTWIKPADLQGWVRIRQMQALGEYRSAHDVRLRVAYDYLQSYVDDVTWTATPTTVGGPEEVGLGPSRQRCRSFKLRITAQAVGVTTPPTGEALKLTGLGVELGNKRGLKRLPASQKAG